jgi:hypothetical protein
VVFGRPVAHHQANAFQLAGLATGIHGARLAVRDAAASYDGSDPAAGFWATQAWREAIDAAVAVTEAGIQLLGGHGFLVDHLAEKRFREARMLGLGFGGLDVALDDLAGSVLAVPDPLLGAMIGLDPASREMLAEVADLGRRYIRPMGLEADRTGDPPPDRPRALPAVRPPGWPGQPHGRAGRGRRRDGRRRRCRPDLAAAAGGADRRGERLLGPRRRPVPARPGLGGAALRSAATRSSASGSWRPSPTTAAPTGAPWP